MLTEHILSQTAHRPWKLPEAPWMMQQQWTDLLFAHWALDPRIVRPLVPRELELDLFDGKAWVAVTPFRMTDLRMRGLPAIPGAHQFLEMNLRTYVRRGPPGTARLHPAPGEEAADQWTRPGIFFFSLDASNLPAVVGARVGFGLPYFWSEMSAIKVGDAIEYKSRRKDGNAAVEVAYTPLGSAHEKKTELERFLVERYCLYEVRAAQVFRTEIHHLPWSLHKARAEFRNNTLGIRHGLTLAGEPDLLHYAWQMDVVVYPPEAV